MAWIDNGIPDISQCSVEDQNNLRCAKRDENLQILKTKGSIVQTRIQCSGLLRENGTASESLDPLNHKTGQ